MTDEDRIRGLWRTMADGWAAGDAALFASVFAEDVDFVTVRGEEHSGRDVVEKSHARLFGTAYRGSTLTAEVGLVRPLADGISLVHATSTVAPHGIKTHAQAVVVRRDGVWTISAFHNMVPKGSTA
jgi:uncharacterized protein (TIGR02246 family)